MAIDFHGLDITHPQNRLRAGFAAVCVNIRAYLKGGFALRNPLSNALFTLSAAVRSIARMNDTTPSGPVSGYTVISADASGKLYNNGTSVVTGLSTNPVSLVPFRPNQSVQVWMYAGDSAGQDGTLPVTVSGGFACAGMVKVRSDGLARKTGIKEPQVAPTVGINTTTVTQWLTLPANTPPWTNIAGANATHNYTGTDTQPPYPTIIDTPVAGSTVTLTLTGTATINGSSHAPGDAGPSTAGFPGAFITTPAIVVFAFTDANGNIIAQSTLGGAPPVVGNVGASAVLIVPAGAAQLQIGIDSQGGTFAANSGSFLIQAVVSTSAITQVASIVGLVNAYIWGDSPHSGPVGSYIWKNPNDSGTGIAKTIGTAQVQSSNNSLIFDSAPEDKTVPVLWSTLDSTGATVGSIDLFAPALESEGYSDWNACILGSLFVPQGGTYAIKIQNKDEVMFGIGGGATSTGGAVYGTNGQSITVANGYPLLWVGNTEGEGATITINVTFPAMGIYPFEFDWDYWYHTGRSLIVQMAPTPGGAAGTIPPLPQGVRFNVVYWGKYRASETGAQSNPSPPSQSEMTPVLANTIALAWSPDPQVDKVDYYRQDIGLPNPTYVATGPNDGLGGTINGVVFNTAIEDTLSDVGAAENQIMAEDDFEPFPSIDTPKSGKVTIVDGVVNWKSGDKFNVRWLPGTIMLIGSPTQMAYSLIARPISTTQIVIPDVPDTIGDAAGDGVPYNIAQPILAAQPLPYLFGPTDNIPFTCGVGDPLRPGTIYWCKGNNLDSAPDTNQQDLTDPSEALVNGAMSGGLAVVFSIKRGWIMVPNFFNAQATATGTAGSTWSFRSTSISRGLFIPRCLAVEGSGKIFFRVDDGWHISLSGQGSESITDGTLYPLFSHEGSTPTAIVRNGVTIYPPDDTKPQLQQANIQGPYLYWDYQGIDGLPHTLTFDIGAMAWILDTTTPAATTHATNQGQSVQGVFVGCADNTIRQFVTSGTEAVTGTVLTPAIGGVGFNHLFEITAEYASQATVTLSFVAADTGNGSYGPSALTLPSTGGKMIKYTTKVSANKWRLLQFQFQSTDPTMNIYLDGFIAATKNWGSQGAYRPVQPFAPSGGGGGEA
jgi:hypothetical protein